ncbi:hypothetical protein DMUE_5263 [Dictyocoela muelleri]|nr:hypothetical protein DMUE_5263 [Dictyocoela muelleri]
MQFCRIFKNSILNNRERIIYRCSLKSCQKRISIKNIKIEIHRYLILLFCLLMNISYHQIKFIIGNVSNQTISSARKTIRNEFKNNNNANILLCGYDRCFEADKTVLCRRKILKTPTRIYDETPDTVWMFGMMITRQKKIYLLKE